MINKIFRVVHTLKGMGETMGFNNMTSLTNTMEEVPDGSRKSKSSTSGRTILGDGNVALIIDPASVKKD